MHVDCYSLCEPRTALPNQASVDMGTSLVKYTATVEHPRPILVREHASIVSKDADSSNEENKEGGKRVEKRPRLDRAKC